MNALDRLEAFLQELMERPGSLLLPKRLQPLQLASAVAKEIEERALRLADRIVIPNAYEIEISAPDWATIADARATLEKELSDFVSRLAVERDLSLSATPMVRLRCDPSLPAGVIHLSSSFARPAGDGVESRTRDEQGTVLDRPRRSQTERLEPAGPRLRRGAAPAAPCLVLLGIDEQELRRYPVEGDSVSIGRQTDNDIAIPDVKMSRRHARLETDGKRFYLIDLSSTNGTRLNGRELTRRTALAPGDIVEMGWHRFRFDG